MSSFYAQYLKERTTDEIVETSEGFATYRFIDKSVYIMDIWTRPQDRETGHATALANLVVARAKKEGCTEVLGTVVPSAKGSTTGLKVLLAYGMTLKSAAPDLIVMRKDI